MKELLSWLRRRTPLAGCVMLLLLLIGFGLHPSRISLVLSGTVPAKRLAIMGAILVLLSYAGAAFIRRDLIRDARKSRRDRRS